MSTPTDRQIQDLCRPLADLATRATPTAPSNLEQIETHLLNAARRNRTGDARHRDGYPTGAGPGDGGEDAPQSSTEAAALTNLGHIGRDPLADHVEAAYVHLLECVNHLSALRSRLALIAHLSNPAKTSNPPTDCKACDRTVMCTAEDPIRSGYCSACDSSWRRWKANEIDAGREPDRARFERWRRQEAAA